MNKESLAILEVWLMKKHDLPMALAAHAGQSAVNAVEPDHSKVGSVLTG